MGRHVTKIVGGDNVQADAEDAIDCTGGKRLRKLHRYRDAKKTHWMTTAKEHELAITRARRAKNVEPDDDSDDDGSDDLGVIVYCAYYSYDDYYGYYGYYGYDGY
jgi:hypothetical protein